MSANPPIVHCTFHPQTETGLSCSACETPICPRCMVTCEVGIKCPNCVKGLRSHTLQVEPKHLVIAGILSFCIGYGYGFISPLLAGFSWIGFIITFFVGRLIGEGVFKACGRKLGPTMAACVLTSAGLGILMSPFFMIILSFASQLDSMGPGSLLGFIWHVIPIGLFLGGLVVPFREI